MDTVKQHTEEVFKLKFVRSIAEALQIPVSRVKARPRRRSSLGHRLGHHSAVAF